MRELPVKHEHAGSTFEEQARDRLADVLERVPWLQASGPLRHSSRDSGHDFELTLKEDSGLKRNLVIQLKSDAKPSNVKHTLDQLRLTGRDDSIRLLVSQRISARVAELCEKHNVSWMDLAGNCRITGPSLYVERTGIPPISKPLRGVDFGSWPVGRVLRVLLAPENAGRRWTQREIGIETSNPRQPLWPTTPASLGLINKVVRHLKDEAYLEELPERGFVLRQPVELLKTWKDSYRYVEHTRSGYFTLLQSSKLSDALKQIHTPELPVTYASFSAAEIQAPAVRHLRNWLFVHPMQKDTVLNAVRAKAVDSGENLVLITPADDGVYYLQNWKPGRPTCTNPVQTYLDLPHGGGRGDEASEAILEQCLKPAWTEVGLL